jgi:uncharacterized protein (TIGR02265 family)
VPASTEPVVYDTAVESMFFRALKGRVTPALKDKLRAVGLDLDQKLRPTYPKEMWLRVLEITTRELYPTLPPEERYFKLGAATVEAFSETAIGKAIVGIARLMGPRRGLTRLPQAFEAINNFMVAKLTELAPNRFQLWLNEHYGQPSYVLGALTAAVAINRPLQVNVRIVQTDGNAITFEISWDE